LTKSEAYLMTKEEREESEMKICKRKLRLFKKNLKV